MRNLHGSRLSWPSSLLRCTGYPACSMDRSSYTPDHTCSAYTCPCSPRPLSASKSRLASPFKSFLFDLDLLLIKLRFKSGERFPFVSPLHLVRPAAQSDRHSPTSGFLSSTGTVYPLPPGRSRLTSHKETASPIEFGHPLQVFPRV